MVRLVIFAVAVAAPALMAFAHAPKRPGESAQCEAMAQRYRAEVDTVSRYAAFNAATGEHLSGAQQAAAQAREANAMSRARMSLDAARGAGCHVVALAPSPQKYSTAADMCAVELIGAQWGGARSGNCDVTHWTAR